MEFVKNSVNLPFARYNYITWQTVCVLRLVLQIKNSLYLLKISIFREK